MRPPLLWYNSPQNPGLRARLLSPLAWLYAQATARRVARTGYKAKVPVICVGNINAGGTGKTPTVIALAQLLTERGYRTHVVSRGYGGSLDGPILVDERTHSADEVGDEPLLVSAFTSVWVAKDRAQGARAAERAGADVILLDDGMQNPSINKDLTIVVVDARRGFGNGCVLPAGPLREPVEAGLARGDILLTIGSDDEQAGFDGIWAGLGSISRVRASLDPLQMGINWSDQKVMAFAGIGHPEKFFTTLRALGADILRTEALGDHQPLTPTLMKRLELESATLGAQLVTTEKDAVRLPRAFRMKVLTLPVRLSFENPEPIERALAGLELD